MSIITTDLRTGIIELTKKCYTGCTYCFKKLHIHPKADHVPLKDVLSRIDWIIKFTDARIIILEGGESLLHPNFIDICDHIISKGRLVSTITSAVISKKLQYETQNLQHLLELYEQGNAFTEISYHGKRNHQEYVSFVTEIRKRFKNNFEALKKNGFNSNYDLISTVVISENINGSDELLEYINSVLRIYNIKEYSAKDTVFRRAADDFYNHFQTGRARLNHEVDTELDSGLRLLLRFMGEAIITKTSTGTEIYLPDGQGHCPSTSIEKSNGKYNFETFIIRADGGLVFPNAQCVDMNGPLLNVDIHKNAKTINSVLESSLKQIREHIAPFMGLKKTDLNMLKTRTCPLSKTCTGCWKMERPWQAT